MTITLQEVLSQANTSSKKYPEDSKISQLVQKLEQDKIIHYLEHYHTWSLVLGKGYVGKEDTVIFNLQ